MALADGENSQGAMATIKGILFGSGKKKKKKKAPGVMDEVSSGMKATSKQGVENRRRKMEEAAGF